MTKSKKSTADDNLLSKNRKAYHDYEMLHKFEAGIVLHGDEVKSIKAGQINLKGAYVEEFREELFLRSAHVSPYKQSINQKQDPIRKRKLILHRSEIEKIIPNIGQKGIAVIPLEVYLKKGLVKVSIAIGRGKKFYDKRHDLKKRVQDMEIKRAFKKFKSGV